MGKLQTGRNAGRRGMVAAALAATVAAGAAACAPADSGDGTRSAAAATTSDVVASAAARPSVALKATVSEAADNVSTSSAIGVSAVHGTVSAVTLTAADGTHVTGQLSGGAWKSTGELAPKTRYTLRATATPGADAADGNATLTQTFTTGMPKRDQKTTVMPSSGSTVGVGYPIVLTFDYPVAKSQRDEAEKALAVKTSKSIGPASWHWNSDKQVEFRPQRYWPARTHVDLHVALSGVKFADGTWGTHDRTVSFDVGRAQIVKVDGKRDTLTVVRDGKVVRTGGVSLGKAGFLTRSGTKVIMSKEKSRRMRSSTIGIDSGPNSYDLVVPYALRVTNSGEFLHGAPWNSHIGRANVSHGCTNLSLANAKWLYETALVGDPVETTGTDRGMESYNGLGGVWNMSWSNWTAGSAL